MGIGSILRGVLHTLNGTTGSKERANFVPFTERTNTPEALKERDTMLREKYLWKGKTGWGAGGAPTVFPTEAAAMAEAERLETQLERIR